MRKHRHRTVRPLAVPMLINRGLKNDAIEVKERMHVEAFVLGCATPDNFDHLADMRDALMLSAACKKDTNTLNMCRAAGIALANIMDRFNDTGRLGTTGDEITILREFCTTYRDYWLRQPSTEYDDTIDALTRARSMNLKEVEVRA